MTATVSDMGTKELAALSVPKTADRTVLGGCKEDAGAEVKGACSSDPIQDIAMSGDSKIPFKRKVDENLSGTASKAKRGDAVADIMNLSVPMCPILRRGTLSLLKCWCSRKQRI